MLFSSPPICRVAEFFWPLRRVGAVPTSVGTAGLFRLPRACQVSPPAAGIGVAFLKGYTVVMEESEIFFSASFRQKRNLGKTVSESFRIGNLPLIPPPQSH